MKTSRGSRWAVPILVSCLSASPVSAQGPTFEGSLSLTSDYLFRGFSQTSGKPARQVGADLSWDSICVSFWGSNVDFGDDLAEYELDFGVSWSRELGVDVSLTLTATHYVYVGYRDGDYSEFFLFLKWRNTRLGMAVAPKYFGTPIEASYVELEHRVELPRSTEAFFHVGYNAFENDPYVPPLAEYLDASLGVRRSWAFAALELTLQTAEPVGRSYLVATLSVPFRVF